jgi:putative SOS response-associated peptidase YedK
MNCKILDIEARDGVITGAKYLCSMGDVQTEGWWFFKQLSDKPFAEVQEADVVEWVTAEAGEIIQATLERQIAVINKPKAVAPWLPQTFIPEV